MLPARVRSEFQCDALVAVVYRLPGPATWTSKSGVNGLRLYSTPSPTLLYTTMSVFGLWVINKAGGLVYNRDFGGRLLRTIISYVQYNLTGSHPRRPRQAHLERVPRSCRHASRNPCHYKSPVTYGWKLRRAGHRGGDVQDDDIAHGHR